MGERGTRSDALPDGIQQDFTVERLCQDIHRAALDSAHRRWDVAVAREEYDRDPNIRFRQLLLHVESAYARELDIQHQATWWFTARGNQELLP